ncbi:MAG: peptidylprolyl isomerase [Nitrospirae bacterium]|nr:peptidylprolyl isomerase [Nitrospirota bacterium]
MKSRSATLFAALLGVIAIMSFFPVSSGSAEKPKKSGVPVVAEGKTIKIDYTLKVDGKIVDTSKGKGPLEFKVGSRQMIPGFEKAVMGMKVGEKKTFTVSPKDGFGPEDPKAIQTVPRSQLSPDVKPVVGMKLSGKAKDGRRISAKVIAVKKDEIVVNLNHPLAGKTLNFDVEVVAIN